MIDYFLVGGGTIISVAAGAWGTKEETKYLKSHPELYSVPTKKSIKIMLLIYSALCGAATWCTGILINDFIHPPGGG